MTDICEGNIIEESLKDNRILNNFEIRALIITDEQNPIDRWHIYTVRGTKDIIKKIAHELKAQTWYAHFWNDEEVLVVFKHKIFEYRRNQFDEKKQEVIDYGKKLGIPMEKLDFPLARPRNVDTTI